MMRLANDRSAYHRFSFSFDFDADVLGFCRALKSKWGWKDFGFDAVKKVWVFSKFAIAEDILEKFPFVPTDEDIIEGIRLSKAMKAEELIRRDTAIKIKEAVDTAFEPQNVKGKLYEYQKLGVEFLVNSKGRGILADEMGLGKTLQALAYMAHEKLSKTLIICPASVKYNWENEVRKWTSLKPRVITTKTSQKEFIDPSIHAFIINYDLLRKFFDILQMMRFDLMVVDEAHMLKSVKAQRTKIARMLAQRLPRIIFLSGTPFLNRPSELYPLLDSLEPGEWGHWMDFTRRYCAGKQGPFGWDCNGVSNMEEFKKRLAPLFLRRKKAEVLTELPDKIRMDVPVELEKEARMNYMQVERDLEEYLLNVKKKDGQAVDRAMQAEGLVRLNELRQITTRGKMASVKEIVRDILETGDKVIIFSCYNEPLLELKEEYGEQAVLVIGSTPLEERQASVDAFQGDEKVKVFLGGMKSAGSGITLTAGNHVVFMDYSWTPADHAQAQDRAFRIGQKKSVNVYQVWARDTIDEYMVGILSKKEKVFNDILEGNQPSGENEDVIKSLLKAIENKREVPAKSYS